MTTEEPSTASPTTKDATASFYGAPRSPLAMGGGDGKKPAPPAKDDDKKVVRTQMMGEAPGEDPGYDPSTIPVEDIPDDDD